MPHSYGASLAADGRRGGEGQHVGRRVLLAKAAVQLTQVIVIREDDGHFGAGQTSHGVGQSCLVEIECVVNVDKCHRGARLAQGLHH